MARREFPALGFDPAPGDPDVLVGAAERTRGAARTFATAAEWLAKLRTSDWHGDAGDAFRTAVGPLPGDLAHATKAHTATATALADYGAGLRDRQRRAADLEVRAAAARARQQTAIVEVNRIAAMRAPRGPELDALRIRYNAAKTEAETVGTELAAIVADARRLHAEHDAAAHHAARSIRAASDAPYEKPGRLRRALDRVKKWIGDHADVLTTISTVLKGVSTVLGLLALVPGLQFLAPFAIAAAGLALAIDATVKFTTGRGSWKSLALDAALTVLPTARVARTLRKVHSIDIALKLANRRIPPDLKGRMFRRLGHLPEGVTREQADKARTLIRQKASHYGDDVIVHGSRGDWTAFEFSDVDIGLRVDPDEFARIHKVRFSEKVETQEEKEAMVNSMIKGIVHGRRAGLLPLHDELVEVFGRKVDISVVRRGGMFDPEPWIPL